MSAPFEQPWRNYVREPDEIYKNSFSTIEFEADLTRFAGLEKHVAIRIIHACGMVEIAREIVFSDDAIASGLAALTSGAPIICDVRMVEKGLIDKFIIWDNPKLCAIAAPQIEAHATQIASTKTAGGIQALKDHLQGAIVIVGNAPTALFRVLELAEDENIRPSLVIGMPVGFVGAAESKDALLAANLPHMVVRGRQGGSAMAAAAFNALAKCATKQGQPK